MKIRSDNRTQYALGREPRPDRMVVLRACWSRQLIEAAANLPARVTVALNTVAFVSLTAALLFLVLL